MNHFKKILFGCVAPLALASFGAQAADMSKPDAKAACEKIASSVKLPNTVLKATYVATKDDVTKALLGKDSLNPSAAAAEGAVLPACRVEATMTPVAGAEIKAEYWLPTPDKWNGRFLSVGAGGSAGTIDRSSIVSGAARGYATSASDAGSHTKSLLSMKFGRNPEWRTNFAYRGVHLSAVTGKEIVQAFYATKPKASLFMGCSGGGYEAMGEAQRYPDDYNGILAGDPALHWEKIGLWQGWSYVASHRDPAAAISAAKLDVIYKTAMAQCDALDGVTDGIIGDPRQCKVNFKAAQCKGADAADCLTAPQIEALTKIYAPFNHPRTKEFLFPGFTIGAESAQAARARVAAEEVGSTISAGHPGPMVWTLPENFTPKDWLTFDFDKGTDQAIKDFAPYSNSNPDLSKLKAGGAKIIMYTGWADPNLNPETLVSYYEQMKKIVGGEAQANSFSRLFMVPGMNHCSGGPGPNVFGQSSASSFDPKTDAGSNILLALDRWVVDGVAPEQIVAAKYVDNNSSKTIERTRPLCAYPRVAKWSGKGSTDDAKNFTCTAPQD